MEDKPKDIKKIKDNRKDYKEKYIRALADYENTIKRFEEEKIKLYDFANNKIIMDLISVVNDIEIALDHIEDENTKRILEKLIKILESNGLEQLDLKINETDFNPEFCEAIEVTDGPENKITKIYRKGYLVKGKLLQTAIVAVGKKNS